MYSAAEIIFLRVVSPMPVVVALEGVVPMMDPLAVEERKEAESYPAELQGELREKGVVTRKIVIIV